jgi:AraC-like DNA-binding protein
MKSEIENLPKYSHKGIIEKYRFLPGDPTYVSREYEILPDGYFDLAFLLSDSRCGVFLAGPFTQRSLVSLNNFELFAIRFRVGRAPEFLDIEPAELVDTMIQLPMLFGMRSEHLCEILWAEKSFDAKQRIIEELIHDMELRPMMRNRLYCQSAAIIESYGGQIKVNELASHLGVSTRTLERQFVEILGFPPKQFIRLVRFQKAIEKLRKMTSFQTYADIAYESGYSDQSHFINDFKFLSGSSPGGFKK